MPNAIVLENQKQGNPPSEWGLNVPATTALQGYADEFSIAAGDALNLKIDTVASSYRIDIYRLGYYDGDGARLVGSIDHQGGVDQPDAIVNATTGAVDAGNWSVTDTWQTPEDLVSGVYIAKLVRTDGVAGESQIPFIVRNDSTKADIVVQTDDTTWQAYNNWGGSSLYTGAAAVSYNRPFTLNGAAVTCSTCTCSGACALQSMGGGDSSAPPTNINLLFSYTYPAIRWLEQNGYSVDYISGMDSARDPNSVLGYKTFISTGHDEYWSGGQRTNVEAARDAGVNLMFWGGNDVYWRTRWEPGVDGSGDPYRTLVSYKTSQSGRPDPSGDWTGLWRDLNAGPTWGITPENGLTGTFYMVYNTPAEGNDPMVVDSRSSDLRLWRNTPVAALADGQSYNLGRYLGYEWNVDPLNSSRPNGLIHLSSTQAQITPIPGPENPPYYSGYQYTLPDPPGFATHNLTLYRAESGALVFSAGTISWGWALDDFHTGNQMPASDAIQQAMVNLLADMGVQPGDLEDGLVVAIQSTDFIAPGSALESFSYAQVGTTMQYTISGSAFDFGGVVAGVQISTDAGSTWRLASGTTDWSYTWRSSSFRLEDLRIEAIDDSANIGDSSVVSQSILAWRAESNVGTRALGWDNVNYTRILADVNGDGGSDYVAFGDNAVFVNFGGTRNGLPIIDFSRGAIVGSFSKADGFTADMAKGVDYVGAIGTSIYAQTGSIIWAQTNAGIEYLRPVAVTATGISYETTTTKINAFGVQDGWTGARSFDFAFTSDADATTSIFGFGQTGISLLREAFSLGGSGAVSVVSGSAAFGTSAGWDSRYDVLAVRDFRGNELDLNGDGIVDVVGMGRNGIVYALGEIDASGNYGLDNAHQVSPSGAGFSRGEGWSNESNKRILADVNGDGRTDIVGFGDSGVWLALGRDLAADGSGAFTMPKFMYASFGTGSGWTPGTHEFGIEDVNGDGLMDLTGFGDNLTSFALGQVDASGAFSWASSTSTPDYSTATAWNTRDHLRTFADVNGDGTAELVVSGDTMTYTLSYRA